MCGGLFGSGTQTVDSGAAAAARIQAEAQQEQLDYQRDLYNREQQRIAEEKAAQEASAKAAEEARQAELEEARQAQLAEEEAYRQQQIALSKTGTAVSPPSYSITPGQKAYAATSGIPGFTDLQKKVLQQFGGGTGFLNQSNTLTPGSIAVGGRTYT